MKENHDGHMIIKDAFSQLSGVVRGTPGDCYCATCKKPVALVWNNGRPIPYIEPRHKRAH